MPRKAREKYPEAIYHIICRSGSELLLFRDDDDKEKYLDLLKRYTDQFKCSIYAYCLMDNHLHFHFDPRGFDVSKFMHHVNTAYVRYYNRKYNRHGHLFQSRFESRILDTDDYNLTVSAYIHNNPHDIEGFSDREENYRYSSYGIYLGKRQDTRKLIDKSFIMGLFNIFDAEKFIERYFAFVSYRRDVGSLKELKKKLSSAIEYEYISGRTIIARDLAPAKVISFISEKLVSTSKADIMTKGKNSLIGFRAFSAYVLKVLCGLGYREICSIMHNITISGCSRLCSKGYDLLTNGNAIYASLFNELISFNG